MAQTLKEVEALVVEFERKLERLRVSYDQYFLGIQKREPVTQLKDVVRLQFELDRLKIRNSGLRFRFRSLVQRFNTQKNYWRRVCRQIEAGTYKREVRKLKTKLAARGLSMPSSGRGRPVTSGNLQQAWDELAKAESEDASKAAARAQAREPDGTVPQIPVGGAPTERPSSAAPGGMGDNELQSLYQRFIQAKRSCGENVDNLKYEKMVATINKQLPRLKQLHGDKDIGFNVVIKDGRAILKAKAKPKA